MRRDSALTNRWMALMFLHSGSRQLLCIGNMTEQKFFTSVVYSVIKYRTVYELFKVEVNISHAVQITCCDKLIIWTETHACVSPVLSIMWICAKYNTEFPLFFALILYNSDSNYSLISGIVENNF